MFRREKYGHIPDQAQRGKAQAIDGGDAMNACKLQCDGNGYLQWIWPAGQTKSCLGKACTHTHRV